MRTTIELPDDVLKRAKSRAALEGISLRALFLLALEKELNGGKKKGVRVELPKVGGSKGPIIPVLTGEQIDEALFG